MIRKAPGPNSEYPELNLSMAVNGTDTQIDAQVGQKEASRTRCQRSLVVTFTIDVFPNGTLAGGNATKGIDVCLCRIYWHSRSICDQYIVSD